MPRHAKLPQVHRHKRWDLAYIRIDGRMIYLGKYGSEKADRAYRRTIAEWLAAGSAHKGYIESLDELVATYLAQAKNVITAFGTVPNAVTAPLE